MSLKDFTEKFLSDWNERKMYDGIEVREFDIDCKINSADEAHVKLIKMLTKALFEIEELKEAAEVSARVNLEGKTKLRREVEALKAKVKELEESNLRNAINYSGAKMKNDFFLEPTNKKLTEQTVAAYKTIIELKAENAELKEKYKKVKGAFDWLKTQVKKSRGR